MTKIINLYKSESIGSIEFMEMIDGGVPIWYPRDYEFIELISHDYQNGKDLMFAYDNPKTRDGTLYLGYFRDGIVDQ